MKKHAIIPVFIPHKGCPNDCVFCNQKKITARQQAVTPDDVKGIVDTYMSTLSRSSVETIELSFFGGSFTGIPIEEQSAFLDVAKKYKEEGIISKIHMSTRPDYIDERILDNLKKYDADVIELGVQSFDDEVLRLSNRGHNSEIVYKSSELIKEYGFELGIQLMIGLPGDTLEKCVYSAGETVKIGPSLARLYPTIVINDTELYDMYMADTYQALSQEEAILRTKEMYKILDDAGINIIRVGLKSTDIINENGEISGNTYHPAFRQLVEADIARERLEADLACLLAGKTADGDGPITFGDGPITFGDGPITFGDGQNQRCKDVLFLSNSRCFSAMTGNRASNRKYFEEKYPQLRIHYNADDSLADNRYSVRCL